MTPSTVDVAIALFAYSGNGGVASTIPELALWLAKIYYQIKTDSRIANVGVKVYCDTPITMTRNRAVRDAKAGGFDMLLMLDSDNEPDAYLGTDLGAKPFWQTAFDFAYERLNKGLPTCIGAPYCGPPPSPIERQRHFSIQGDVVTESFEDGGEVPYLFEWTDNESGDTDKKFRIALLTRLEAQRLKGIFPVAALPTGVFLSTLNAYEPLPKPYYKYEFNEDHSEKLSTEDVVATRDISLYWKMTKGVDVIFAACDSWALHHKTKKVGKPQPLFLETIAEEMREAILTHRSAADTRQVVDYTKDMPFQPPMRFDQPAAVDISKLPRRWDMLGPDQNQVYISDEEWSAADESVEDAVNNEQGDGESGSKSNQNGHVKAPYLAHKMVNGRKVALIDLAISDKELEAISSLASWAAQRSDGPVRAAVLHSGTGLSAAAIESVLPEGSHIFCLDNLLVQPHGRLKIEQFTDSFQSELESGRVMAEIEERDIQCPLAAQDLDLVFIESGLSPDLVSDWLKHVKSGGVIAGLNYDEAKWLDGTVLQIKTHPGTSLWAAPVGLGATA